ncbi:MAG: Crp/Fnr family transcriptional regulator [Comamonadaceae bacterium]|nr:MAG: Crp/Fnr family transcriptional regulator [Comamonadaceae bacterium]
MPTAQNRLIELLPREARANLLAICEPVDLVLGDILCRPGDAVRHVHFPVNGFVSLLADADRHAGLELAMVGREGMLGAHLALDVGRAPMQARVQGGGSAWRVKVVPLRRMLVQSAPLQNLLRRYVYVLMAQLASSAACLHHHHLAARLARWLLMAQDRAHSDRFRVTQELLGYLLGVRRVGVTAAARALQERGLIAYVRGDMNVRNRRGLEAQACGCYASDAAMYARQLGALPVCAVADSRSGR